MKMTDVIDELVEVVGRENVSEDRLDKLAYATDASRIQGETRLIVWAKSREDVSKVVSWAGERGVGITVRGAGSGLVGGCVPKNTLVLDLTRMNRILSVSWQGKTAHVEAGVILDDLNTTLSPKLYFPVKPSSHEVATIGGMISANSAGLRAIKYGKTCDWIAKLYVVDGLGKIAEASGSKIQDFCGKEGTTGVIVSAELKLSEPPQKISLDKLEFENLKDLIEKVKKFSGRKDVSALEFIDRKTSEFTGFANGKHVLLVEYEGDSGEIKNREEIEKIWVMRDGVYPALASRGYAVIEDPKIPADRMEEFLTWLEACEIPSFGHIGIGIIHPCYPINSEKTKELFEKVRSLKGDVSGEHGIGIAKKNYAGIDVVSRVMYLKKKYDPKKILNKGVLC